MECDIEVEQIYTSLRHREVAQSLLSFDQVWLLRFLVLFVELHVVNGCVFVSMHCLSLHLGYCLF